MSDTDMLYMASLEKRNAELEARIAELEDKHWNECRQIAHYEDELRKAKELLKAAVEDINAAEACDTCEYYPVINSDMCQKDDCYKWRYADEALALIGEDGEQNDT
ncbi:MAG TPA: hypothetical protein P5191_09145 [Ruminococcus sp.]|nr:hypothetical protein [Ruminococcus sp.]